MKKDGYQIEHHNFQTELRELKERLSNYAKRLEETDDQSVFDFIITIEDRIREIYGLLEEESKARTYVDKYIPTLQKLLSEVGDDLKAPDEEVRDLQTT